MKRFWGLFICFVLVFSCIFGIPKIVEGHSGTNINVVVTEEEINSVTLEDEITLDYVLTLLARIHYLNEYPDKTIQDVPVNAVKYCQDNGIFNDWLENYKVPLTKGIFTSLLLNTVRDMDIIKINYIEDGSIPGVEEDYFWKDSVYECYKYGLICGEDAVGTFTHENTLTVGEMFAVIDRVLNSENRVYMN